MNEKSLAQKIARFIEIVSYFALVPATFGLLVSLLTIFMFFPIFLVILGIYVLGCFLLRGYYRRSRGRLDKKSAVRLWIGSIVFNLIPAAVLTISLISAFLFADGNEFESAQERGRYFFWWSCLMLGYYQIVGLAIVALRDDLKRLK